MLAYALMHRKYRELNEFKLENTDTLIWVFTILRLQGITTIVIAASVPGEWVRSESYQYLLLVCLSLVKRFKRIPWTRRAHKQ